MVEYRARIWDWTARRISDRRWQLAAAVVAMMAIAGPQYTWTLFTIPLAKGLHAQLSDIQIAFTLFVVAQSWFVPLLGYAVDRFGARIVVAAGGVLVGVSWIGSGLAASLWQLYACSALGGLGVGAVYGACLGLALKWFPDRRGLAAGLAVGAYGSGAALLVVPIRRIIEHEGYRTAFLSGGLLLGLVLVLVAWPMMAPFGSARPRGRGAGPQPGRPLAELPGCTPAEMIRSGAFHLLYVVSILVMFGGLLVAAQLKPLATAYHLDKIVVLPGMDLLSLTLMASLLTAALARPLWGWLSDRIGRERTMIIAFALGSAAILGLLETVQSALGFAVFSSAIAFAWGAAFVVFSAAIGDMFGSEYAATNCGIHYTSKGVAAIFAGWGAAKVLEITGSWLPVLWIGVVCNGLAALLIALYLHPMVARVTAQRAARPRLVPVGVPAHSEGHGD
jgi:MFS transporter, OFA family, oxalate/formate antiporter